MAKKRRDVEAFSLSFLDCICCGFGAIVLLLVFSKIYEPAVLEKDRRRLAPVDRQAAGRVVRDSGADRLS